MIIIVMIMIIFIIIMIIFIAIIIIIIIIAGRGLLRGPGPRNKIAFPVAVYVNFLRVSPLSSWKFSFLVLRAGAS